MSTTPLTPEDFKPTAGDPKYFQQGMFVIGPAMGGQVTTSFVNPLYCGTMYTAQVMAAVLAALDPQIVMLPPFNTWSPGSPFQQIGVVPWLKFANNTLENAGLLASSWTHGYSLDFIEGVVFKGVENDIEANA